MSDQNVVFEDGSQEKSFTSRRIFGEPVVPGLAHALIRTKLVRSQKQAEVLMIGIIVVTLGIGAYFTLTIFYPGIGALSRGSGTVNTSVLERLRSYTQPPEQTDTPSF